jgi:hypothetical protein
MMKNRHLETLEQPSHHWPGKSNDEMLFGGVPVSFHRPAPPAPAGPSVMAWRLESSQKNGVARDVGALVRVPSLRPLK